METARSYRIVEPIGKGAFGTVYRAQLQGGGGFQKEVAVKLLHDNVASEGQVAGRLRDEARLLGLLRHRAILKVDGLVKLEGRWAIIMEYVAGTNVKEVIRRAPIPVGPALEIIAEVAAALDAAWRQTGPDGRPLRLIHRDIKPSNIQLGQNGDVKLLDFGIARADFDEREADTQSMFLGSIGYTAPERLDLVNGPAADVYGLGVVLWEALCGRRFGKASVRPDQHVAHVEHRMEIFESHHPGQTELNALVRGMVSYEAKERPSARGLVRQCRRLRERTTGMYLADWAKQVIPRISMVDLNLPDDEWIGVSLIERPGSVEWVRADTLSDGGSAVPMPEAARLRPVPTLLWLGTLGLVAVLSWSLNRQPETRPVLPPSESVVYAPPEPVDPYGESPLDFIERTAESRPPDPHPAPPPPPESTYMGLDALDDEPGSVHLTVIGDALHVKLIGEQGAVEPGDVPAGSYDVMARFEIDEDWVDAGLVVLAAGRVLTLECRRSTQDCALRR